MKSRLPPYNDLRALNAKVPFPLDHLPIYVLSEGIFSADTFVQTRYRCVFMSIFAQLTVRAFQTCSAVTSSRTSASSTGLKLNITTSFHQSNNFRTRAASIALARLVNIPTGSLRLPHAPTPGSRPSPNHIS